MHDPQLACHSHPEQEHEKRIGVAAVCAMAAYNSKTCHCRLFSDVVGRVGCCPHLAPSPQCLSVRRQRRKGLGRSSQSPRQWQYIWTGHSNGRSPRPFWAHRALTVLGFQPYQQQPSIWLGLVAKSLVAAVYLCLHLPFRQPFCQFSTEVYLWNAAAARLSCKEELPNWHSAVDVVALPPPRQAVDSI